MITLNYQTLSVLPAAKVLLTSPEIQQQAAAVLVFFIRSYLYYSTKVVQNMIENYTVRCGKEGSSKKFTWSLSTLLALMRFMFQSVPQSPYGGIYAHVQFLLV